MATNWCYNENDNKIELGAFTAHGWKQGNCWLEASPSGKSKSQSVENLLSFDHTIRLCDSGP